MANTLDQRILGLIKKYMEKLVQKKVLTSMEEVEANTNETNLVAAPVVAELNNKLGHGRVEFVITEDGLGYRLDGADTVYPFRKAFAGFLNLSADASIPDNYANCKFPILGYRRITLYNIYKSSSTLRFQFRAYDQSDKLIYDVTNPSGSYDISKCSYVYFAISYLSGSTAGRIAFNYKVE